MDPPAGGEAWYDAFWWLHRRRTYHGMSGTPQAIDVAAMVAYAHAHRLEVEELMYFVDRLDMEWLLWTHTAAATRRARQASHERSAR